MCLLKRKEVVTPPCAPLDLGRIIRRLQIVADGDDGQEDSGERGERDELHCDRGKN